MEAVSAIAILLMLFIGAILLLRDGPALKLKQENTKLKKENAKLKAAVAYAEERISLTKETVGFADQILLDDAQEKLNGVKESGR